MKKRNIRAQSNIIYLILIILIIILSIVILWNVIFGILNKNREMVELKAEMIGTRVGISDVSGDLIDNVTIDLHRFPEQMRLVNQTVIEVTRHIPMIYIGNASILSVLDVSGSMGEPAGIGYDYLACKAKITATTSNFIDDCCEKNNNCSTASDCAKCNNGIFNSSTNTCYMNRYMPYCCSLHNNCNNPTDCAICATNTNNAGWTSDRWLSSTRCWISGGAVGADSNSPLYCYISNGTYIPPSGDNQNNPQCKARPGIGCCSGYNCNIESECKQCHNGFFESGTCYFQNYIPVACKGPGYGDNICGNNQVNCNAAGGGYDTGGSVCLIKSDWFGNDCKNYSIYPGGYFTNPLPVGHVYNKKSYCEDNCEGIYNITTRLDSIKAAHVSDNGFIERVITGKNNTLGLVTYAEKIYDIVDLTNNIDLLKSNTNSLSYQEFGNTSICQGINKSIWLLNKSTNKVKVMVLMTDGKINVFCNGTIIVPGNLDQQNAANNESIEMARKAWQDYNISVYTIGYGDDIDITTLQVIAQAGNGTYSYADTSVLDTVYNRIADGIIIRIENETIRIYEAALKWGYLKFVFYNDTINYVYSVYDIPQPLETRVYTIPPDTIPRDFLKNHIININKIEVYMVVYTKDGKEVISPLLDTWVVKKIS